MRAYSLDTAELSFTPPAPRRSGPSAIRAPGAGRALDPASRAAMESSFGHDFGRVRGHTEARASELTGAHDALALASGCDIFLSPEACSLESPAGRLMLAHELGHVVQSERGARSSDAGAAALEREAASASLQALARRR